MQLSLVQRVLIIVAASVTPIIAVVAVNEILLRQSINAQVHALALASAEQGSDELQRLIETTEATLLAASTAPLVRALNKPACDDYLEELSELMPQYVAITVFDTLGEARCSSVSDLALNVADRSYFKDALAKPGHTAVGEFTVGRATGQPVLPIAIAVGARWETGPMVAVAALDTERLSGTLASRTVGQNGSLTVADRQGVILARVPFADAFIGTKIPDAFMHLVNADTSGTLEITSQDGTRRILGYVPASLAPLGLYVSAGVSTDSAFSVANSATMRTVLLGLLGLIIAAGLSMVLMRRLMDLP